MQKQVSKHGLLTIALSLLLVVSLGLTATFAAFSGNNHINGNVYFNGNVSVAVNAGTYTIETTFGAKNTPNAGDQTVTLTVGETAPTFTVNANGMTYGWTLVLTLPDNITLDTAEGGSAITGGEIRGVSPVVASAHTISWTSATPVTVDDATHAFVMANLSISKAAVAWDGTNASYDSTSGKYLNTNGADALFTATASGFTA